MEQLTQNSQKYIQLFIEYGTTYGLKVIFALLVFFIGKRIARFLTNLAGKVMKKNNVDVELIGFMSSLLYWFLVKLVFKQHRSSH